MKKTDLQRFFGTPEPDGQLKPRLLAKLQTAGSPPRAWPRIVGIAVAACMLFAVIAVPLWVMDRNGLAGDGAAQETGFSPGSGVLADSADDAKEKAMLRQIEEFFTEQYGEGNFSVTVQHIGDNEPYVKTEERQNFIINTNYKTEADFLNHPDGVAFQAASFRAARAYLNGDEEELAGYLTDACTLYGIELDLFNNIDYIILKWTLSDIKSENEIWASYQFAQKGADSAWYVSMEMVKVGGEWKVDAIWLEG